MKKFLALMLVALMALAAVSAYAEAPESPAVTVVITPDGVDVVTDDPAIDAVAAAIADMGVMGVMDDGTNEQLLAKFGESEMVVNEIFMIVGWKLEAPVTLNITFATPFDPAKAVVLVLQTAEEQLVVDAVVNEDGSLTVEVSEELAAKIVASLEAEVPVLVVVVNEA